MEYANSDGYAYYLSNRLDLEILDEELEELCVYRFQDDTKEEIKKNRILADKLISFCLKHFNDYKPKIKV